MNRISRLLFSCSLALFFASTAFIVPVFVTGCATPERTHEAVINDTFHTTYRAAKEAYLAYCDLVIQNKVSKEKEARADAAWNDFRDKFSAAFKLASNDWNALTPDQVRLFTVQFIAFLKTL